METAKAQLQQAEANKMSADANVLQLKAKLLQAQQDWGRAQKLGPSDALVQSERNIATDLIALYKALGGGWESVPFGKLDTTQGK